MAATFCEEQVVASAERVKGEETSAPLPGLLTVTLPNAGKNEGDGRDGELLKQIHSKVPGNKMVVQTGLGEFPA
jgi:hypothetical protein